ncbi:MAG: MaoC/PaaZ C-terminal domain-containing protein [Alphaproteobacteria bacterium]|nr:MaoC/PaaZ C-terminal domain-containing protein [Alphaproteobacteria bacterium]
MALANQDILLSNLHEFVGQEIGLTDWLEIDQMQVNIFGEVTRWPTWMHNDRERAARESPYGGTIMHGFFLLSLITYFVRVGGINPADGAYSLNYGMDKARILKPVVIGDGIRLRDRIGLLRVEDKGQGRRLCTTTHHIEVEGKTEPAAYVEYLNYWFPKEA